MSFIKLKNIFLLLAVLSFSAGCKKFLEERSQTLQYVTKSSQLDELLVGEAYMAHTNTFPTNTVGLYFPWLNVMDDDITEAVVFKTYMDSRDQVFGMYTWQSKPFTNALYSPVLDDTWTRFYKHINATNIIAQKASEMSDNPAELKRIRGEALFLRAGYYFYMVNLYAQAYNPSTAKTDLGVPLKTTEFVESALSVRASVDAVYQQIIADLNEAELDLTGVTPKSLYHADVNAVNLLQSRVYLYMQDWESCATASKKVISHKAQLYNLASYKQQTSFFNAKSPEAIFNQGTNAMVYLQYENAYCTFKPTDELMQLYSQNDLRRNAFFELDSRGKYRYTKVYYSSANNIIPEAYYSDNFFMRNAEAYLNLAEASAMTGNDAAANAALNTLRQSRFLAANYQAVNLSAAALVNFTRDERRREMCFEGHRWFDLKRYAVNTKYPYSRSISHPWSLPIIGGSALQATLTLLPNDAAYLIPIPDPAMEFNRGTLVQNPERPDRKF